MLTSRPHYMLSTWVGALGATGQRLLLLTLYQFQSIVPLELFWFELELGGRVHSVHKVDWCVHASTGVRRSMFYGFARLDLRSKYPNALLAFVYCWILGQFHRTKQSIVDQVERHSLETRSEYCLSLVVDLILPIFFILQNAENVVFDLDWLKAVVPDQDEGGRGPWSAFFVANLKLCSWSIFFLHNFRYQLMTVLARDSDLMILQKANVAFNLNLFQLQWFMYLLFYFMTKKTVETGHLDVPLIEKKIEKYSVE